LAHQQNGRQSINKPHLRGERCEISGRLDPHELGPLYIRIRRDTTAAPASGAVSGGVPSGASVSVAGIHCPARFVRSGLSLFVARRASRCAVTHGPTSVESGVRAAF
jgi:hypothetical protein